MNVEEENISRQISLQITDCERTRVIKIIKTVTTTAAAAARL